MPYKWSNSFSYDYCYSTYSPINSAASPECLRNYQTPSLTTTATLLTILLTLLLPLNALQMIELLLLYNNCYSTNSPSNSAASPEWKLTNSFSYDYCYSTYSPTFPWMPYKLSKSCSYDYCYSTYSPTNSAASPECLTNYQNPSLATTATLLTVQLTLLLPLNALQIIQFLLYGPGYSSYGTTNSAALLLKTLQMIQFLLLQSLLIY